MLGKIPFDPTVVARGTEFMAEFILNNVFDELTNLHQYNWVLIPSHLNDIELARNNKNIVWIHVPGEKLPKQFSIYLTEETIRANTVAYIVQSEFHKSNMIKYFNLPEEKIFILSNTFLPIPYEEKQNKQINLVYCSSYNRGLTLLLESFALVKDKNITLTVFGIQDYIFPEYYGRLKDLRIEFLSYVDRDIYEEYIKRSHLFVYPSLFEETAGISIMETMAAGLKFVSTDLGAIPETSGGYGTIVKNFPKHQWENNDVKRLHTYVPVFAKLIKQSVKEIRQGKFDPTEQIKYMYDNFSNDVVINQWKQFNDIVGKFKSEI